MELKRLRNKPIQLQVGKQDNEYGGIYSGTLCNAPQHLAKKYVQQIQDLKTLTMGMRGRNIISPIEHCHLS